MMTGRNHSSLRVHSRPSAPVAVSCRDVAALLWEYLDGELEKNVTASIHEHLAACPACLARHDASRALLAAVAKTEHADPASAALRKRVLSVLDKRGLLS